MAVLILAGGCGKDAGGIAGLLVVAVVEVTSPNGEVVVGQTIQLSAVAKTEGGISLPPRDVSWSSSDESRATVSPAGLVRAHAVAGPVRIRASVSGVTGETEITVVPVPIDRIVVSPGQSAVVLGGSTQLTAKALDAGGAELADRSFAWSSGANAIAAVTTTGMVIGMAEGGPVTVTASAGGKAGSATVTVSRRPASRLGFVQQPGRAIAGLVLTPAIRVAVEDDLSGTVADAPQQVTVALTGNTGSVTLSGTRTITTVDGIATFNNLVVDRAGAGYTLTASAPGLSAATSAPFTVAAGAANHLALTSPDPSPARIGIALQPAPTVEIRDGSENAVQQAGVIITASVTSGNRTVSGTTTATTDASGTAVFSNLAVTGAAGTIDIAFSAPGIAPVTTGAIDFGAGAPVRLELVTAPSGSAQSGQPLTQQPVLRLLDAWGNPVALAGEAIGVTLSAAPVGGALMGPTIVATDAGGIASFAGLALIGPAGSYVLSFAGTGLPLLTSPPVMLSAGAGTALSITTQPPEMSLNDAAFSRQPVIQLRDAADNPVPQAGVLVTASIQTGGGLLNGTSTVATNSAGTAVFGDLSITGIVGSRTLVFAASDFVSVVSMAISVLPGAPAQLSLTTPPSASTQSGMVLAQQPAVRLLDVSGNIVSQPGLPITASVGSGSRGALTGTTVMATDGAGVARFTNLVLNGPAGGYTLAFDGPGLSTLHSGPISLTAGAGSVLAISTQPSSTVASGSVFPQQPILQLRDTGGNPVPQSGVQVTATIQTGGGALGGATTVATDASGGAAFKDLSISGPAGARTILFTAGGTTGAVSGTIMVTAAPGSQLSLSIQPSSPAQSSVAFSQQPVVLVRDGSGNGVGGVPVTAAIASGGGTLSGTLTAISDAAGLATFTSLAITGTVGARTLSFTAAGITPVISNSITVTAGPATQLTVTAQPSSTAQSGAPFAQQPVLQLRDGAGNSVTQAGVVVTGSVQSGGGVLGGTTSVTTSASGAAAFTDLSLSGPPGPHTLFFGAAGTPGAISGIISLTAPSTPQLTISTQPSASAQNGVAFAQQPVILLRDGSGNAASGVVVTAAIASGGGALGGTLTATSDAAGLAVFTNLSITGTVGSRTLGFTALGFPAAQSNSINITPGPATHLTITTQPPSSTASGTPFTRQPVIQLRDASGNAVLQAGVDVTAGINSAFGSGKLKGTTTVTTDTAGVAAFTDLELTKSGFYTLRFTSGNLVSVVSGFIWVN